MSDNFKQQLIDGGESLRVQTFTPGGPPIAQILLATSQGIWVGRDGSTQECMCNSSSFLSQRILYPPIDVRCTFNWALSCEETLEVDVQVLKLALEKRKLAFWRVSLTRFCMKWCEENPTSYFESCYAVCGQLLRPLLSFGRNWASSNEMHPEVIYRRIKLYGAFFLRGKHSE